MLTFTHIIVIAVIAIPLIMAITNRIRIDIAALLVALGLGCAQYAGLAVLGPANTPNLAVQALVGFSQPVVVTLLSLFIISRVLDTTGLTRWLARRIVKLGGGSERRIILLFTLSAATLALFMNNVAVGALLLPGAVEAAHRAKIKTSKLLIPVSFGTLLGGSATYFTTANIIVDGLLRTADPTQKPLSVLDFTPTGGLIAIAGIAFITIFGKRLLPDRPPLTEEIMFSRTGSELEDAYQLGERMWEATVLRRSPLAGKTLAECSIGKELGVSITAIWHNRQAIFAPNADHDINEGDILLVIGREDRVYQLENRGLHIGRGRTDAHISEMGVSFIEMVLAPHSPAEGKTLKQLEFRRKYGFTAVALWRDSRSYRTDVADFTLKLGDSFLLVGPRQGLKKLQQNRSFIALEPNMSDQPLERGSASRALIVTGLAIAASVMGFPVSLAMLTAAVAMVLMKLIAAEDAYRAVEWQVIFLVAGMYASGQAMVQSGLANIIGDGFVQVVQPLGPLGLAAGCYLLSAALTHVMGGQVTALVTGPIAISAAISLQTSPQAIAVATAIGCSAAFLSPIAHPVNILMVGPGNYRFNDFLRIGAPMMLIGFIGVLLGMVFFWGL